MHVELAPQLTLPSFEVTVQEPETLTVRILSSDAATLTAQVADRPTLLAVTVCEPELE